MMGAFHLVKISGISGSGVNGTRFVGSSHWKIPRKSGKSKKVGSFFRLERSERNFALYLHVSGSLYQIQVQGKNICHGQFAKQNGFPRAFTHVPVHSLFFCYPLRMTRGTLGKLCRDVAAAGSIPQGNHFRRPAIPVQSHVPAFVLFMANSEVFWSVLDRFNVTLSSLFRKSERVGKSTFAPTEISGFFSKWKAPIV